MRVCLDIEFENKIVCILGAGRVAYRKAKQFCDAGANVYINSIEYEDDFKDLDVNIVSYQELLNLLNRASLAIACTNDKSVNERFINEAKRYKVLTMSVQKDEGQDSFSVSQLRKDHLLLACNTNGSFPLANKMILDKLDKRIALLSDIRNKLHNHRLCEYLLALSDEQLAFLNKSKGIVYLLHGSNDAKAYLECDHLISHFDNASYLFLAKKCLGIELDKYIRIVKDLNMDVKFYLLFWDINSQYAKSAMSILDEYDMNYKMISIDPSMVTDEDVIMHTNNNQDGVVVSMTYSSFMKNKYPDNKYISALSTDKVIERIIDETN